MAEIKFEREHALGLEQARKVAQEVADEMATKYDFNNEWQGDVLTFERSGVHGTLSVDDGKVVLNAKLGILLAAFAPRIQKQLDQNFARYFG